MCAGAESIRGAGLSRRRLLAGAAAAAGAVLFGRPPFAVASARSTVDLGGVAVVPRSEWGGDLAPVGPIPAEPDVRYLLVHHSVDPGNGYGEADVAGILRGFVRFHTSVAKGWPDLAYNFLVDRFGRVWEGRTGSLAGPVAGDATGGNQGFDQLCCFIGNHQAAAPSPEAFASMARLLAALAHRSGVALGDGATATFTSRGSNRHPAGTAVTTPTIAGHRDMSRTQCPGDQVVLRLPQLRALAAGGVTSAVPVTTSPPAPPPSAPSAPSPSAPPDTAGTATPVPETGAPVTGAPVTTVATSSSVSPTRTPPAGGAMAAPPGEGDPVGPATVVAGGAAVAVAAAAGAAWARRRRGPAGVPGPPPEAVDEGGPFTG